MKFLLHPVRLLHPVCLLDTTEYLNTCDNSLFTVWARIDLSITMILNIYFEETEKLFLAALTNTFASQLPHRRKNFGDQKFV